MWQNVRAFAVLSSVALALTARPSAAEPVVLDHTVVRFHAPELGGAASPSFVFARTLAFEARIEALADPDGVAGVPYRQRHILAALERHIAETLLSSLRIDPDPTEAELRAQTTLARGLLAQRVGGPERLEQARVAEGIGRSELAGLLRRRARASLYLDRMMAPMLKPSESELRAVHGAPENPYAHLPYNEAREAVLRWYVSRKLNQALSLFYQNARGRLSVTVLQSLQP